MFDLILQKIKHTLFSKVTFFGLATAESSCLEAARSIFPPFQKKHMEDVFVSLCDLIHNNKLPRAPINLQNFSAKINNHITNFNRNKTKRFFKENALRVWVVDIKMSRYIMPSDKSSVMIKATVIYEAQHVKMKHSNVYHKECVFRVLKNGKVILENIL